MSTNRAHPQIDDLFEEFPQLSQKDQARDPNTPLPLDVDSRLALTVNDFVSARTLILGQTGKGKGNASALITEFLLEARLPLTFVDLEGEGWSFKQLGQPLLVVGRSKEADREYDVSQMGRLAELSVEQGFSVILDFSGYSDEEIFERLTPYLLSLWTTCDRLRTPYHLLLDEVHELVPESGTTPVKALLRRIAKRGRKRGLGVIAMSQETASVDKKFLRQTDIRILLSVSYEADLKTYHGLIPAVTPDVLKNTLPALPPGAGYVVVNHRPTLVQLLRRRTFDPSETPKLGKSAIESPLRQLDTTFLAGLDQILATSDTNVPLERLDRATLIQLVRELRQQGSTIAVRTGKGSEQVPAGQEAKPLVQPEVEGLPLRQEMKAQEAIPPNDLSRQLLWNGALHIEEFRPEGKPATIAVAQLHLPQELPQLQEHGQGTETAKALPTPLKASISLLASEQALLTQLIRLVGRLSAQEKRFFCWLVEHDGREVTVKQLASACGVRPNALYEQPPKKLEKLPFIQKSRGVPASYCCQLADYCQRNLSSYSDVLLIQEQLLLAARGKRPQQRAGKE